MNCERVRSVLFDYRDGSLPADIQKKIEDHLIACSSCRELFEREAWIASKYRACFDERRRAFPYQAKALVTSYDEHQMDHRVCSTRRKRFLKVLVPISFGGVLVFVALLIFRPARLPFDDYAPRASYRAGDLPDPFRDWIERRMIITIEDTKAGTLERIEASKDGIIARSVETRGHR